MSEVTKFTEEELAKIKELQDGFKQKMIEFGDLKFVRIEVKQKWDSLDEREVRLEQEYLDLQKREAELSEELTKKYGDGVLNLDSGEFTKQ